MNTTYGSKKQLTRLMAASSQLLAILMSMLRVSLEYAWKQPRVWLEYACSMVRVCLEDVYTHRTEGQIPCAISPKKGTYVRRLTKPASLVYEHMFIGHRTYVLPKALFLTVLMQVLTLGSTSVWGQTDYSGTYYIGSDGNAATVNNKNTTEEYTYDADNPSTNFYLVPASDPVQNNENDAYFDGDTREKPFLTTYKTGRVNEALWVLTKVTDTDGTYYYIMHAETKKYVIYDPFFNDDSRRRRKCMHLDGTSPSEAGKFVIVERDGAFGVMPKSQVSATHNYWNLADRNRNSRHGLDASNYYGGLLGLYQLVSSNNTKRLDPNSRFKLEEVLERPTFTSTSSKIVIGHSAGNNATIYYTIDGTNPTTTNCAGSGTAPLQINMPDNNVTLKAIAVIDNLPSCISSIRVVPNPTITLAANEYTYDGSAKEPTVSSVMDGETPIATSKYTVTYSGDKINAGTATVNVEDIAGDDLIVYGSKTFTINKKDLTITANNHTISYGDAPADNGVTCEGFVNSETIAVLEGTLEYAYNYERYGNVGSYTITPSGLTGANYDISFVPGTLTVEQKEVGLTWSEPTSFVYDGASHGLTATATGTVNGDEIGVTVTGAQISGGNHTATVSALTGTKAGNYKLPTENTHAFTITPAALTITAKNHTITYGDAPVGNGVTYSGFIGTEDESVLGGTLGYDFSYTQYGDVGDTYTITPKGLTSPNYDISFVAGTLTVNPKDLAITANAMSKTYGDNDPVLTYTLQGLVGSDVITGSLSREAGEDVGTYAITQGELTAGVNYIITYTGASFTITPKPLTITADSDTKVYDSTPLTKNSYTHTELLTGDKIEGVTVTGSQTNAGASDNVLSAAVIKNSNNDDVTANYHITYTNGTLTVTPKPITVKADNKWKAYGEADPTLTYTSGGLLNNDAITGTLSRVAGEDVGIYAITVGGLTAGDNYEISFTGADLTIVEAELTVTANNHTITYGDEPAGNGVTCEGFVNNDTYSSLDGTLAYDFSYTRYGDVGNTYTIKPKGLTSSNYKITFSTGKLTVSPKEVGLTWSETTSFPYDGSPHAPTATAKELVNGDKIGVTVSGAETNAGNSHKATASALTGTKKHNYKLPEDNTHTFTITPKSIDDGTTLADGYTLNFGENNTILLTDDVIGSALVPSTDYSVGEDTDTSEGYSERTVTGTGNYTGSFTVRNASVAFSTDTEQDRWSGTFVAEKKNEGDIGFALPEGFTAFIISDIQGEWAIPEPLNYIPADVPVLLVANHQTQGFVVTEAESEKVTAITPDQKDKNMLEKVTESTPGYDVNTESAPFGTKQIYLLYKNEFVFNKAGNLKKGKVYLNPNHTASSPEPAPARLMIAWNHTTGIEDGRGKIEDGSSERWYTMDGRCLSGKPTTKGLYIVNGKKIVIK